MNTILYFTATWCGPCRSLAPRMEKLKGQINYRKIDIDQNREMAMKYGVRSVPSLVLVNQNGEELRRLVGVKPDDQIINFYNG